MFARRREVFAVYKDVLRVLHVLATAMPMLLAGQVKVVILKLLAMGGD